LLDSGLDLVSKEWDDDDRDKERCVFFGVDLLIECVWRDEMGLSEGESFTPPLLLLIKSLDEEREDDDDDDDDEEDDEEDDDEDEDDEAECK